MMKKFDVISRERALEPYKDLNDDDVISVWMIKKNINDLSPVILQALEQQSCDKCVYSTKDGYCQYDDITETIPPLKPCTEQNPCETCEYAEGSPFCLQYCPYDAERKKEQEFCDDAISRQAVLDINFKRIILTTAKPAETIEQKVKALPPVAPKQKGHWDHGKEISREYRGQTLVNINYLDWYCSNCHCVIEQSIKPEWSYCPNCGAKMIEPQESEEV